MNKMVGRLKILCVVWAVLLSGLIVIGPLSTQVSAGTPVYDDIVVDTTWTLSGSPYWISGKINVLGGVTLTIEPGVEVKFNYGSLWIHGNISAVGNSVNRITFTSNESTPKPGDWGAIGVLGNAHFEYVDISYGAMALWLMSNNNTFFETTISYSKYQGISISPHWRQGTNVIQNSTITYNGNGIYSNATIGVVVIENSTISNNTGSGLIIDSWQGEYVIRNSVISFNKKHGIELYGDSEFDITCNGIFANDETGIRIAKWSLQEPNASIHHNNIISNVNQATDDGNLSTWDDGSEGSYWSDYKGNDTNGDGIGDEPYVIDADSQDNFPFINPIDYCPLPSENMPPVAVAKPDYQLVDENTVVWFYGNDSYDWDGVIIDYTWDFGDGPEGYGESVSHIYSTPGTYTVTLTVMDDSNLTRADTCTVEVEDIDNISPVAVANPKNQTIYKGESAYFYGYQSYDVDGWIVEHRWDFGDGAFGYGENVTHVYTAVGNYTVTLRVRDDDGALGFDICGVTVLQGLEPPVAVAKPKYQIVHVGEEAWFYGNESYDPDGYIVNYTWDFGDGASGYGEMVSHIYSTPGNYSCMLTVMDNDGLTDSDWCSVTVLEQMIKEPDPPSLEGAMLAGNNLENVSIRWQLSADDGSGEMDVINYAIYHSLNYDPKGVGYEFMAELPAGSTSFLHVGVGDGESNNHFYCVQANDTEGLVSWSGQAGKFVRLIETGRRLASIPLIQDDTTLEVVLQTLNGSYNHVRYYRSSDQSDHWKSYWTFKTYRDLFEIDHTMGFWIEMTGADSLVVAGLVPGVTAVELRNGWNLVSYPSFTASTVQGALSTIDWKMIDGYSDIAPYHLRHLDSTDFMTPGEGYWIWVDLDQIWEI